MTAPHFHKLEEARAAIKSIEHNSSGPGGPSGKMAGPPTGIEGGSGSNQTVGKQNDIPPSTKGTDWAGKKTD
jgi:hypothetical protein